MPVKPTVNSVVAVLADDPTIKSLTAKLNDNPDDGAARTSGQVYASKGAYDLAIKFQQFAATEPQDVEAQQRCWARTVVGDLQSH